MSYYSASLDSCYDPTAEESGLFTGSQINLSGLDDDDDISEVTEKMMDYMTSDGFPVPPCRDPVDRSFKRQRVNYSCRDDDDLDIQGFPSETELVFPENQQITICGVRKRKLGQGLASNTDMARCVRVCLERLRRFG